MSYEKLKGHMADFHAGNISKTEIALAIHLWQRSGSLTGCPHIKNRSESIMRCKAGLSC